MLSLMGAATTDRAVGAVLASGVGDALGAPYEFQPPNPTAPCAMEGGGGYRWEPGEWTDDTQMALAVLAVLARGSTDVAAMGEEMVRWYRSKPRDVGIQTAAVLGGVGRRFASAAESAQAYQAEHPESAGNGALMRTGPVALAHLGDRDAVAALAAAVASLTHPHPDSVDACVLWSLAIE
jgi:ADP-ribosyl-[dinitrogen reductase] hydrolase